MSKPQVVLEYDEDSDWYRLYIDGAFVDDDSELDADRTLRALANRGIVDFSTRSVGSGYGEEE